MSDSNTAGKNLPLVSASIIRRHCTPEDCWIVVDAKVWDISRFLDDHPGGKEVILRHAGRDASKTYNAAHAPSLISSTLPPSSLIGLLDTSSIANTTDWTLPAASTNPSPSSSQTLTPYQKPPLSSILSAHDFETIASRTLSAKAWAFYSSAATDCVTHRANSALFERIWFVPRVMRDMSGAVDMCVKTLGVEMQVPFFVAPAAMARLAHGDGECAIARACGKGGVVQCISTQASFPASEIIASAPGHPFFFQLYVNKDRLQTEKLLHSLPSSIKAIFVTADAAVAGKREADERVRSDESLHTPMSNTTARNDAKGGALGRIMGGFIDPKLNWEDIVWLRKHTNLPIVVKGIMSVADAVMAADYGVQGIVLSNHGGRNLDTSPPSLRTLLQLRFLRPDVFERLDVFLDGGVRRGTDVLKALCLGAKAVGLGRPFLYSLNYGEDGVSHLIEILRDELQTAMKLIGVQSIDQLELENLDLGEVEGGLGLGALRLGLQRSVKL